MLYALDLLQQCDEAIFQGPSGTVQKGHRILVHTLYGVHFDVVGCCARCSMLLRSRSNRGTDRDSAYQSYQRPLCIWTSGRSVKQIGTSSGDIHPQSGFDVSVSPPAHANLTSIISGTGKVGINRSMRVSSATSHRSFSLSSSSRILFSVTSLGI